MLSYCYHIKLKKNTESIMKRKCNNKTMQLSKNLLKIIKKQEPNGLLSSLVLKTPLSTILLFGDISFWMQFHWITLNNVIVIIITTLSH